MKRLTYISAVLATLLLLACRGEVEVGRRGLYYWRTTLRFTPEERAWMDSVGVETIYLKLFDVVADKAEPTCGLWPDATLLFPSPADDAGADSSMTLLRGKRIVPVVFVSPGVIEAGDDTNPKRLRSIASILLRRVDQMMTRNALPAYDEVQIDYDWTQSNQRAYFAILQAMADTLHSSGRRLSTTIRLHQLGMATPPADRGALMLYNTGRVTDPKETNSILTEASIAPYLDRLDSYGLPLVLALPQFSWNVVFRADRYQFLAPQLPLADTALFRRLDDTHWAARAYQPVPINVSGTTQSQLRLLPGDVIRHESSSDSLNAVLMQRLFRLRPSLADEVITFR